MGGGAAMRVAAKVTGLGINGGLRNASSVHLAEQSVTTTARKSSRPVAAIVSSTVNEDGKSAVLISSQNGKVVATASVQRPSWEIDEWEFTGDEELVVHSLNPIPRVVFGGVPTLEEAEEATSELKDALEKVYFSASNPTGCGCLTTVVQEPTLSVTSDSGYLETKACVTSETAVAPLLPHHAFQAFMLLKESPEAQSVVSSLASDKSVWNAVMQNDKVMEFFQSQRNSTQLHEMDFDVKKPVVDNAFQNQESLKKVEDMSEVKHSESSGNGFKGFVHSIKLTVVEMVNNLSGFFQNIFGDLTAGKVPGDANRSAKDTYVDSVVGASFMALAVLVIMVILVKRV